MRRIRAELCLFSTVYTAMIHQMIKEQTADRRAQCGVHAEHHRTEITSVRMSPPRPRKEMSHQSCITSIIIVHVAQHR